MTRRPILALLAVATLVAAAACGGEAAREQTTSQQRATVAGSAITQSPTTTSAASTATTADTRSRPPAKKRAAAPAKASPDAPLDAASGARSPARTRAARALAPKRAVPPPIGCLAGAGLIDPRSRRRGVWGAIDRANGYSILVRGPFDSFGDADAVARSLAVGNYGMRGGLYVVTARVRSNLAVKLQIVASCLGPLGSNGQKGYTF